MYILRFCASGARISRLSASVNPLRLVAWCCSLESWNSRDEEEEQGKKKVVWTDFFSFSSGCSVSSGVKRESQTLLCFFGSCWHWRVTGRSESLLYKLFVEWLSIELECLVEWKPQKCLYPKKTRRSILCCVSNYKHYSDLWWTSWSLFKLTTRWERGYITKRKLYCLVFLLKWNLIGLKCKFVKEALKTLHQKEIRKRYDVLVINLQHTMGPSTLPDCSSWGHVLVSSIIPKQNFVSSDPL